MSSNATVSEFEDSEISKSIDEEAEKVHVSKEFQESVIKYIKVDDLIRKKQNEILELKSQKKPCEAYIIKYLDEIGEDIIGTNNGKLRKNKSETKVPLSQIIIKQAIEGKINNPELTNEILKIMQNRPTTVRVNLKRTFNRKK